MNVTGVDDPSLNPRVIPLRTVRYGSYWFIREFSYTSTDGRICHYYKQNGKVGNSEFFFFLRSGYFTLTDPPSSEIQPKTRGGGAVRIYFC